MAIITPKDSRLRAIGHVVKTSLRRGKDSRKSQKLAPARGLTIVHNPPDGVPAAADIVAIHGLDGSFDSWTVGQRENWLTERLPTRFAPTRIITFSYDADVLDGYELTRRVVDGSAYRLAEDLSVLREETDSRRRPIVFIAHSMGGLIVKRALVSCHESTDAGFRGIGQSTAAVHFFGTPSSDLPSHLFHEALRKTAMVQRPAGKQDRQFNSNAIPRPPSEAQSKWLELQLQPFKPLIACMEAYTYYESKETPGIGLVVARQSSFSSTISRDSDNSQSSTRSRRTTLNNDHANLMRFGGSGEMVFFDLLVKRLENTLASKAREKTLMLRIEAPFQKKERKLSRPLSWIPSKPSRIDPRLEEEASSALSSASSSSESRFGFPVLVLYGPARSGKSAMARFLATRERTRRPNTFIYWLNAETCDTIRAGYLELFKVIFGECSYGMDDGKTEERSGNSEWRLGAETVAAMLKAESIRDLDEVLVQSVVKSVKEWLIAPRSPDFLLVFDNVVDPYGLYDLLPLKWSGGIILTTRERDTVQLGWKHEVKGVFKNAISPMPLQDRWLSDDRIGPMLKVGALLSEDPIPLEVVSGSYGSQQTMALHYLGASELMKYASDSPKPLHNTVVFRKDFRVWARGWLEEHGDVATWARLACTRCLDFCQRELSKAPHKLLDVLGFQRLMAPHARACYHLRQLASPEDFPDDMRWDVLGEVCLSQGFLDEARGFFEISLESRRTATAPEPSLTVDRIEITYSLSTTLQRIGDVKAWVGLLAPLDFEKMVGDLGGDWVLPIKLQVAKAEAEMLDGQMERGEKNLQTALDFLDALDDDPDTEARSTRGRVSGGRLDATRALVSRKLGEILGRQKKWEGAQALFRRAFIAYGQLLGAEDPSAIDAGEDLANAMRMQGRLDDTLRLMDRLLECKTRAWGEEHPSTAETLAKKAAVLDTIGDSEGAKKCYEQALRDMTAVLGDGHPSVLRAKESMAAGLCLRGDYRGADDLLQAVLGVMKSLSLVYNERDIGVTANKQRQVKEQKSRRAFEELLDRTAFGSDHGSAA